MLPVVGFLQNMYLKHPDATRVLIERRGEEFRRRFIAYALFAGCLTGQMLREGFGRMALQIVWEETSREIASHPWEKFPADLTHMRRTLEFYKPKVVLAFGRVACEAIKEPAVGWYGPLITGPHPASRDAYGAKERLAEMAKELREKLQEQNVPVYV